MRKERLSKHEVNKLLLNEAVKHVKPIKITEFTCPYCGGIAATWIEFGFTKAECYCCSSKGGRRIESKWQKGRRG